MSSNQQIEPSPVKPKMSIVIKTALYSIVIFILGALFSGPLESLGNNLYQRAFGEDTSDKYIAVIISDNEDTSFTIPKEFRQGFGEPESFENKDKTQNIEFKFMDDFLDNERAEVIAKKLVEDQNCIMIIGNSTSELTDVTLNTILESEYDRMPFLLPIATADDIIKKSKKEKFKAILRMMPDNSKQAEVICSFIQNKNKSSKVAILVDEDNTNYSYNLSQNIADGIMNNSGTVVLKKNYGNSNRLINELDLLQRQKNKPDFIVFVGISSNGMLLAEELELLNVDIPVIFTDGCTVSGLINKVKGKNVYYFLSAVTTTQDILVPTYYSVGEDAAKLSKSMVLMIDGTVTRAKLSNYLSDNKSAFPKKVYDSGSYEFDDEGNNKKLRWNIYSYKESLPVKQN